MKISVCNTQYPSEIGQFAFLKEAGFDGCDFSLGHYFSRGGVFGDIYNVTDEQIKEHFTMLREEAAKVGFEICQTHSQFPGHPKAYDYNMDEIIKREEACIAATHYLGAKFCVVHPVFTQNRRYDIEKDLNFNEAVDFYKQLTPALEKYDVYCCIENMWHNDIAYGHICATVLSRAQEMVDMCEVLGERFKICVDVGHGLLTQDDPCQMVRIAGDKLGCLHTHDNDGILDLHTFPYFPHGKPYGMGWKPLNMNWEELMKALDDVNYRGTLSFELGAPGPEPLWMPGYKYMAKVARYLTSLREIKY